VPTTAPAPTPDQRRAAWWATCGAGAGLLGTLLPWVEVLGIFPIQGISTDDGKLVAAGCLASGLLFIAYAQHTAGRGAALTGVVLQAVVALVLLVDCGEVDALGSLGSGFWLGLLGAGTGVWQGLRSLRTAPGAGASPPVSGPGSTPGAPPGP
jgi:hypothetical protein